jgi:hypothetical protein
MQQGVKFLSAGLMQAIRNPTAHEKEEGFPVSRADCLNILSLINYLFNKLDEAVFIYNPSKQHSLSDN